jgi:hypothetical protein
MPEYQAKIVTDSPVALQQARALTNAENTKYLQIFDPGLDANAMRPPDYFLYIFNTVPFRFDVRRPPHHPCIIFKPCPAGKPYEMVMSVPNVVNIKDINHVSGAIQVVGLHGERFATDLLNPANTTNDIWLEVTDEEAAWIDRGSDDLTRRGLFWSRKEVPEETELAKCKQRLVKFYRSLIAQAEEYARSGNNRDIGEEHHRAADFFHLRSNWHIIAEIPDICMNCGEALKPGLAYHINSIGKVCVIDWARTVNAGIKTWDEAPPEYRPKAKAS